jgi:hypothetical protein
MKIDESSAGAVRLAKHLWSPSEPISKLKPADRPFDLFWWKDHPQVEGPQSPRHKAALELYLCLAAKALPHPMTNGFPARFDFKDAKAMRPDKGAIKTFLDHGLIEARPLVGQMVFDLTAAGQSYRDEVKKELG